MMALPMNSLYSLTWGEYGSSLVSAIQLLRCQGDLVDCTLAAGGRSFPAHKIVLCAASPFLLDLLKNTPCKHPVVMLAGVNANDLEALLEFVYRGEVSVDHAQLPSLLQAAQCLNIQGLAPQTVTKDDYTTHSIQLQHMIPQHHVKTVIDVCPEEEQDQLIATIATAPQQTVHAQVVEDIHQAGPIIADTGEVKDVINQFLPARKRRPRVKKMSPNVSKIARTDGMDSIMTSPTATNQTQTLSTHENGDNLPLTSTPIKSENQKSNETMVSDASATPTTPNTATTSGANSSTGKTNSSNKARSRSQSEQPATCPICYAVIRQSRNLRRHLELRHFAKPGIKKERKVIPGGTKKQMTSTTTGNSSTNAASASATIPQVQTVQSVHTLQTVQVKKDPDAISSGGSNQVSVAVSTSSQQQQQQQVHHQIIDQSGNITTATGNGQPTIVTQQEHTDGTTSLSIAQVQTLQGHQLIGNINQATIIRNDDQNQIRRMITDYTL